MKMILSLAAALVAGATLVPAVADASPQTTTTVRTRTTTTEEPTRTRVVVTRPAVRRDWRMRHGRRMRRDWRMRRGHMQRVCTVRWHHGTRVRTCRTMRGRW